MSRSVTIAPSGILLTGRMSYVGTTRRGIDDSFCTETIARTLTVKGGTASTAVSRSNLAFSVTGGTYSMLNRTATSSVIALRSSGVPIAVRGLSGLVTTENGSDTTSRTSTGGTTSGRVASDQRTELIATREGLRRTELSVATRTGLSLVGGKISVSARPVRHMIRLLGRRRGGCCKTLFNRDDMRTSSSEMHVCGGIYSVFGRVGRRPTCMLALRSTSSAICRLCATNGTVGRSLRTTTSKCRALVASPQTSVKSDVSGTFRGISSVLGRLRVSASRDGHETIQVLTCGDASVARSGVGRVGSMSRRIRETFDSVAPTIAVRVVGENVSPLSVDVDSVDSATEQVGSRGPSRESRGFDRFL